MPRFSYPIITSSSLIICDISLLILLLFKLRFRPLSPIVWRLDGEDSASARISIHPPSWPDEWAHSFYFLMPRLYRRRLHRTGRCRYLSRPVRLRLWEWKGTRHLSAPQ